MLIPPGVDILVNDCLGTETESPSVQLKEILSLMSSSGVSVAAILPMSPDHLIVVGYCDPVTSPNAKSPPTAGERSGGSKRR